MATHILENGFSLLLVLISATAQAERLPWFDAELSGQERNFSEG